VLLFRWATTRSEPWRTFRAIAFYPLLASVAWPQSAANLPALRSAVPLLCTENHQAARTRVRGTGVLADSGGTLLTAAHVIQEALSDCTLSVMIPDEEWSRFRQLHAFLVKDCHQFLPLDLAVCRIRPADSNRDWAYIRPARIRGHSPPTGEPVWITAFTGWGVLPWFAAAAFRAARFINAKMDAIAISSPT
jgi:hypothetical protein